MMKSKHFHNLMRLLLTAMGAGIGAALVALFLSIAGMTDGGVKLEPGQLVFAYAVVCTVFAAILFIFSERLIASLVKIGAAVVRRVDAIPARKLIPAMLGMLVGFVIAALLSIVFSRMGDSIFTLSLTAILFLSLGVLGYTIGYRRSGDFNDYARASFRLRGKKLRRKKTRKATQQTAVKLVDTSALMDGRVADVSDNGFIEGVMVVPDFVVEALRRVNESPDAIRRARGQRGMEILEHLKRKRGELFRVETTESEDGPDEDVRLLRLAHSLNAAVITCDYSLNRAAQVSGLKVLSIDSLAGALRPALVAGEAVSLVIVREGKEASQGVGYLPDGTMVVVDGARSQVGETVQARVTSVLQTNAGRMIFAKKAETDGKEQESDA